MSADLYKPDNSRTAVTKNTRGNASALLAVWSFCPLWYARRRIWLWINLRIRPLRLKLRRAKNRHTYTNLQVFPSRSSALLIKHHCINILWCHAFLHYLLIRSWHALRRTLCSLYLLRLDFLIRNVCRLMGILWWMSVLIAVLTGSTRIISDWHIITMIRI